MAATESERAMLREREDDPRLGARRPFETSLQATYEDAAWRRREDEAQDGRREGDDDGSGR